MDAYKNNCKFIRVYGRGGEGQAGPLDGIVIN
jgi:hypothetical protein